MKPCGTHAAYVRHHRRGEPACEPCLIANREYQRARFKPTNAGKPCAICGESITAKGRQKYCSKECGYKAFQQSDAYKRGQAKRNAGPRVKVERVCACCGKTWMVEKHNRSRHCSVSCGKMAKRERGLVHVGAIPFTWLPAQHPVNAKARSTKSRIWCAGNCAWCTTPFVVVDQLNAKFCSPRCAAASGRRDRGRFSVPPATRLAIYERDQWSCQLCLEPVDPDLRLTDPYGDWAPSLDHIVPQSKGGSHDPDNLRLAHRWCNAIRGDDTYHGTAFFAA